MEFKFFKKITLLQKFSSLNFKSTLVLFIKGILMGSADIIPGVSGGTIALITNIYEKLINALQSINLQTFKLMMRGEFKTALSLIQFRFLFTVFTGICIAIISLAHLITYCLTVYPVYCRSIFFGLIAASIMILLLKIQKINWSSITSLIFGGLSAYFLVGLIPLQTSESLWFIFLSGALAIIAMILPGISGAFILLILSKYTFMITVLKTPFEGLNTLIILVFLAGCVSGLLIFSRVLNLLLQKYHQLTFAFLAGLVAGSMRKIWPWKEVLERAIINGKSYITQEENILPLQFESEFFLSISLIVIGFISILLIHKISIEKKNF